MVDQDELQRRRDALAEETSDRDVSDLAGYREPELPWSYETIARNLVLTADRVLDLGTGTGRLLAGLADVLPEGTVATEGRAPHLPVARRRLTPEGIEVLEHDADRPGARLPLTAGTFDLVLSRHGSFDPAEVARVLTPNGTFLTQQVGGDDLREVGSALGLAPPRPQLTLMNTEHALVRAGMTVEWADVFHGAHTFEDLSTLLRYLRRAPRHAPDDLDADRHRESLDALAAQRGSGPLTATASRFIVLARSPAGPDAGRTDFTDLPADDLDVPRV